MGRKIHTLIAFVPAALWAASSALATPTMIRTIALTGNTVFSEREILEWMASQPSRGYSETILQNDFTTIAERYRELGYLNLEIRPFGVSYSADSSFVDLTLDIHEGRRTVLGEILLIGNDRLSSREILEQFTLRPGNPLDASLLERDIHTLLNRYERLGYPFARCFIHALEERHGRETDYVDLTLRLEEGPQLLIDEVRVEGNTETDPSVVIRETRLAMGEVYNPAKVDRIQQRLRRLNIFSDVSEPELYLRGEKGGLLIRVKEGNTNTFDGIIGYIPGSTPQESGYLMGLAAVSMRNLFGTGRKLSFRWQREDRFSQELAVRYIEPWIFGVPANVGGGFLQRRQDTSYVRRVLDLKGDLMLSEELSVGLQLGSESVIPAAERTTNPVFRSSTSTIGLEVLYDTRNDTHSPTAGARYRTDFQYGSKRIRNVPPALASRVSSSVVIRRLTLDLDFFLTVFRRQVVAVGLHGRELQSGQLEESEMYRFGGTHTLRGYRENQFLGSRVAWSNAEYRFLLAQRSFLFGFVDTGYYFRPAEELRSIPQTDGFRYGYGTGVQVESPLGIMRVSFALGQGDSFTDGKVHFGLINEF